MLSVRRHTFKIHQPFLAQFICSNSNHRKCCSQQFQLKVPVVSPAKSVYFAETHGLHQPHNALVASGLHRTCEVDLAHDVVPDQTVQLNWDRSTRSASQCPSPPCSDPGLLAALHDHNVVVVRAQNAQFVVAVVEGGNPLVGVEVTSRDRFAGQQQQKQRRNGQK